MIEIKTTKERIESQGGLLLLGSLAKLMKLHEVRSWEKRPTGAIITQLFGMFAQGETSFEASRQFRGNDFAKEILGLPKIYSPETIRIYLESMCDIPESVEKLMAQLQACSNRLLAKAEITPIKTKKNTYIPYDFDTSPLDNGNTKKENIGYTYKGFFGYQPMFGYYGGEGYMALCELRPGNQHCQKGTPEFIRRAIEALPPSAKGKNILFRFDSGNDSIDTVKSVLKEPLVPGTLVPGLDETRHEMGKTTPYSIIKRNLRKEDPDWWLTTAKTDGAHTIPHKGINRYVGKIELDNAVCNQYPDVYVVFEVIEHCVDSDGTKQLFPKIEVNTFWTNLDEDAETVIELYHDHATMEQFHSELKTDMGVERLPSGKYGVNQVLFSIAMCAFNALRFIGQTAIGKKELLPIKPRAGTIRKRIGTVIRDIIHFAGK
ncbi:hypothetical protein FACS189445_6520 [Spirochaetia bacterium]|nr:hypothetical protein FACS189445_6520 [Spirochaetia bacterium]